VYLRLNLEMDITDKKESFLADESATLNFGEQLKLMVKPGMIIYLNGNLGAGKTTLVRGFICALGHTGRVKSPSYALVEPYTELSPPIYHFDLYRLEDPEELEYLGFRDYLKDDSICIFEWPDKGGELLPLPDLQIDLSHQSSGRLAVVTSYSN